MTTYEKQVRILLRVLPLIEYDHPEDGTPDWDLLDVPHAAELPAVRWKLHNIELLKRNPGKHEKAVAKLRKSISKK